MSNFINLMSLIQGGKMDAEKSKLAADKWTEQKAQEAAMMKGLDRVKEAMQFATTPNDRLNVLDKNPGLLTDPYTSGWVKQGLTLQKQIQDIRSGVQSAKVKVTETHVTNRFNDDFSLIASDPENDELIAAISFKRQNPTTMPDPEMISAVAKAKQSLLQKQAAEKQALADGSKTLSVGAGTKIINPATGKVLFDNPSKASSKDSPELKRLEEMDKLDLGFANKYTALEKEYAGQRATLESGEEENKTMKVIRSEMDTIAQQRVDLQRQIQTARSGDQAAPAASTETVIMTDKDGNQVKVPKGRVDELKKKGYQ